MSFFIKYIIVINGDIMKSKFIGICKELNELGQGIVYYDNNMIIVDNLFLIEALRKMLLFAFPLVHFYLL